ncbi:L,D-transpeptidase family protein [Desulforamulus hydrothermalis]|uniref:ErfK/YbiS/YcfS/YnhG family protein n=1 Tax=Desulforamulus hydrothermalis Lam5 = DSM 18033 TaxID=1121428 RepID=K8DYM4_9FIRM|nr:peptidoglycan-binding protein [Desulforamulus hydrothermalis]CCO07959.1 ErfK/YbiS/YcfS/YnhG family protein [Desulforamulus hydrothermalis Lam5 = DSM 18033]SHG85355.1 Lipoprotein-anchoring transpeptidase ErfK/SrfK [Desulforamulus hydrothermalis Lam5 = DSM 18033]
MTGRQKILTGILGLIILLLFPHLPCAAQTTAIQCCPLNEDQDRILIPSTPPLQGDDVKNLQAELKALQYYYGPLSGIYGPLTQQAVKKFQQEHGLPDNAVVDWEIWHKLALLIEKPVAGTEKVPPPAGKIAIIVDTTKRKLTVMADGKPYQQFNVACGKPATPTPVGTWQITHKAVNWGTGFGSRWLGLNVPWGMYGIHGTNKPFSIGSYASHGCIRMHNSSVEQLYPWVPRGTPVYIVGSPFGVPGQGHNRLVRGDRGSDVYEVQRTLKRLGYYDGKVDGIFGYGMEAAVKKFRQANGLPPDNCVDRHMYQALGL